MAPIEVEINGFHGSDGPESREKLGPGRCDYHMHVKGFHAFLRAAPQRSQVNSNGRHTGRSSQDISKPNAVCRVARMDVNFSDWWAIAREVVEKLTVGV
ncbi:hypothetical protein FA13DRAFT_100889 [Coprinellus micaceus]|uniref:Uncharacterized protein n=1 Tax=Coprinellus micaceus TaxID=71717 RepID=A0A4Y7SI36_COPMI|nr:hypothetical protein FA13DRAFT_100889 [Coprinellus micaceus]